MKENGEGTLKLKVTEALSKDMGRAFGRMGPEDLENLEAAIGDIVEVSAKRRPSARRCPLIRTCAVNPAFSSTESSVKTRGPGSTSS